MNNPFIIAEIGINHNGDINIAKQLIDMAVRCGADAVKFQKRTVEYCYTKDFLNSPRESPWGQTQREQKIGLEFGQKEYDEIDAYCYERIEWFASAFDVGSLKFLVQYNLPYYKIPHQLADNKEMAEWIVGHPKHTFISTLNGLTKAGNILKQGQCPITILYCPADYSHDKHFWGKYICVDKGLRLSSLFEFKEKWDRVGFSCHNYSILPPILAVALGAVAVEVHITLDRAMYGTDQACSFEEEGLHRIVRETRRIKEIMG